MTEKIFTKSDTKVIKALAILLMLFHHLFAFPNRILNEHVSLLSVGGIEVTDYLAQFGKICVALFLFLGGLGSYYSYRKYLKTKNGRSIFVFSKIKALYLTYWRVFAIVLPISLLLGTAYAGSPHLSDIVWDVIGATSRLCAEWWFFSLYILYTALMPLFYKMSKRSKNQLADVGVIVILCLLARFIWPAISEWELLKYLRYDWMFVHVNDVLKWLPYFYIGIIFAKRNTLGKIKARYGGNYLYCAASLVIIAVLICIRRRMGVEYDCFIAPVFVACSTILFGMPFLKWPKRALVWISGHSTNMWLIHSFFIYQWCQGIIFKPKYNILIYLFFVVVCILGSVLINCFWKLVIKLFAKIAKLKIWQFQVIEEP